MVSHQAYESLIHKQIFEERRAIIILGKFHQSFLLSMIPSSRFWSFVYHKLRSQFPHPISFLHLKFLPLLDFCLIILQTYMDVSYNHICVHTCTHAKHVSSFTFLSSYSPISVFLSLKFQVYLFSSYLTSFQTISLKLLYRDH